MQYYGKMFEAHHTEMICRVVIISTLRQDGYFMTNNFVKFYSIVLFTMQTIFELKYFMLDQVKWSLN